ncbi:MAG: hypothetical protein LBN39_11650, partial [Planctomycetaceae bacterium]|nr:hypothetical protein [Planctomycetaceae bacterium]
MRFFLTALFILTVFAIQAAENSVLFTASEVSVKTLKPQSSKLTFQDDAVLVETQKGDWPGFYVGGLNWNLDNAAEILIEVKNVGTEPVTLNCRLDSPKIDNATMDGTYTHSFSVEPGATVQGKIPLPVILPPQFNGKFFGMRGFPGGARGQGNTGKAAAFHKDAVAAMTLFLNHPAQETKWSVKRIVAVPAADGQNNAWQKMSVEEFFPMIDEFGQFKYGDWKGKVHSVAELKKNIEIEKADLAAHPGPKDIDKYGGYTGMPKRKATGHFRVEKINGKWWFIDPDGHLFWSHGADCVISGNATTPVTDREFYFEGLPDKNDPVYNTCRGTGSWAPHNYYEGKGTYQTFNFTQYNLMRKYGSDWKDIHAQLVHKRLRSWGMNTIANWSNPEIYNLRKTVYTANMGSGGKPIAGSGGYWGKFPDPFSKEFEDSVNDNAKRLAETTADDPWCLGYFVDNEISWGGERSLAIGMITSPANQPGKSVFAADLKAKYGDVEKLNGVWGTKYTDWDAVLQTTDKPNEGSAQKDLDD